MTGHDGAGVSRRSALKAIGLGAAAAAVAGASVWAAVAARSPDAARIDVQGWAGDRGTRYHIAHRGSGDVLPEHSMPAYWAAVEWGARCLEISVCMTSDGVLFCMHDPTYDRTSTGRGRSIDQPSSVLDTIRIWQPQLGAAWTREPPRVPLFEDVLRAYGGRVVLAVEAKVTEAFEPMMAMVARYGLRDSVIVKAHHACRQVARAQSAGYPVFCYLGAASEATSRVITTTAARLNPQRDYLVIPAFHGGAAPFVADSVVTAAVDTGVPVWVYPLHRRSDADHFFALGVRGAICSSYGYIAGVIPAATADSWATQAIAAGEMTKDPASNVYAPEFSSTGELTLAARGVQHFITLGQIGPLTTASGHYAIDVDLAWRTPPTSSTDNVSIAFGRADDSYYEHRGGRGDGYHATLRADGKLGLYRHHDGEVAGEPVGSPVDTPPAQPGRWAHLRIDVSAGRIVLARTDAGATITAPRTAAADGYAHLGRSSPDGEAVFRALSIT